MEGKDFHHPYKPYEIQQQLMTAIYRCIEEKKVGIFESPTGTGKSLSLICGSLTWLRDFKRQKFDETFQLQTGVDDEPQWIIEAAKAEKSRNALHAQQERQNRLHRVREKEKKLKERLDNGEPLRKRARAVYSPTCKDADNEMQFALEDYDSDTERYHTKPASATTLGLSAETQALLKRVGMLPEQREDDDEIEDETKVYFCSRTHSQLSQFAAELRKVRMPPSIDLRPLRPLGGDQATALLEEDVRQLTLGSRKTMCIYPRVNRLAGGTAINERCLELQKPGMAVEHRCPYLPTSEDQAVVNDFRDNALAKIRDIEELSELGKQLGICPYYASRSAIKPSEIVALPYPLLLQKSSREALEISLKDHVVIIDEAHNLMDAIMALHSATVSLTQLSRGRAQIMKYLEKFRNRLKGRNRVYLAQLVRLIDSLISYAENRAKQDCAPDGIAKLSELMAGKNVDQINVFKLATYLQESKLARKVDGYAEFSTTPKESLRFGGSRSQKSAEEMPVLMQIQSFLLCLMNPSAEGRFFYSKTDDDVALRYMLLDPTAHFQNIVEEARAVILCGGTMSPMDDYVTHLFSYLPPERLMTLSCGHVIANSNLVAWPVAQDTAGKDFDFTFERRVDMIPRAGRLLERLLQVIPDGVVAFFPSYAYLEACVNIWKTEKLTNEVGSLSIWDTLGKRKPIFMEPPRKTPDTQRNAKAETRTQAPTGNANLLTQYSSAIFDSNNRRGALLLSVVNGSLSEGINFSDRLGRGVVVFGLPFPNPHSPEWKAKTEYLSLKARNSKLASGSSKTEADAAGKTAASEFYTNTAMRAVNQAIGRAIRHQNDYAAILVVDRRYGTSKIQDKLPGWIRESLGNPESVEKIMCGLRKFFDAKAVVMHPAR